MKAALRAPLVLLLAALLLGGCGTRFLYNRLDTVLYLYVSTQVSLGDAQARELRSALRDFLDWHRESELPRYVAFMEALARDAAAPLGRARIDAARSAIEGLWRDSAGRGAPAAARWLAGLTRAQREELFASLAEEDDELHEEYCDIPARERLRQREQSAASALRDWIGKPAPAQRALLGERLAALEPNDCAWIQSRAGFRSALHEAVVQSARDARHEARVVRLLTRPEERWDADYRARFQANSDRVLSLLADLDATLDARQRETFGKRLQGYARDFSRLAQATPAPESAAR